MSNHFSMGAINKETNNYEYPRIANRKNNYKCPSCDNNVIFRNGKIKQPHYAHKKSNNPCFYYDKPNETQIHKDAKMLMKTLLDNKNILSFYRKCDKCSCKDNFIKVDEKSYRENSRAIIEYKFNYNDSKKRADVALIENENIICIFEICYRNKTSEENRPEPWVEINAEKLLNNKNLLEKIDEIEIQCIREYICESCSRYSGDLIKQLEKKGKEQLLEKNELLDMRKEDERTLYIEMEKEQMRIEREELHIKFEMEKEQMRIKIEELHIKLEEERLLKIQKNMEQWKHSTANNERCDICNINKCKCKIPCIIKDNYNRKLCSNNNCNKLICKCVRLSDFGFTFI